MKKLGIYIMIFSVLFLAKEILGWHDPIGELILIVFLVLGLVIFPSGEKTSWRKHLFSLVLTLTVLFGLKFLFNSSPLIEITNYLFPIIGIVVGLYLTFFYSSQAKPPSIS